MCAGFNPFTIAAAMSLIAVATSCNFTSWQACELAVLLTLLNLLWNCVLLVLGRTVCARFILQPRVVSVMCIVSGGAFFLYALRFFLYDANVV